MHEVIRARAQTILSFLSLLLWSSSFCQMAQPSLQHLTINDGLSQGFVSAISQDHQGFLWVGTRDGLNRFDGFEFRHFKREINQAGSISGNEITCIHEDNANRLWVGTSKNGLNLFDREKEVWEQINLREGESDVPRLNSVSQLQEDVYGRLWVKTHDHRLYCVEVDENEVVSTTNIAVSGTWYNNESSSYKMIVLKGGDLLLSAYDTLMLLETAQKPFRIRAYEPFQKFVERYGRKQLLSLAQHENGNTWFGTTTGIYQYLEAEKRYEYYPLDDLAIGVVNELLFDRDDHLWFRKGFEVFRISIKDLADEEQPTPVLICNEGRVLFEDRSGIIWIGTIGYGLHKYVPQLQRFRHVLKGQSVYQMLEVGQDSIWLAGSLVDLKNQRDSAVSFSPLLFRELRLVFGSNAPNSPKTIWLAHKQPESGEDLYQLRLHRIDLKNKGRAHYDYVHREKPRGSCQDCYTYSDRTGMVFVVSENSILRFNPQKREFDQMLPFAFDANLGGSGRAINIVFEDQQGDFWIGTQGGIIRVNKALSEVSRITTASGLSSDRVLCFYEGTKGEMWIGTDGGGINRLDQATGAITYYLEQDGLPNNVVYGILADQKNFLWMSTNQGLSRFDPSTETFRNYDIEYGLQSNEFNTNSILKRKDGSFLFGGMNGVTAFTPEEITENPTPPQLVFTDFRLNNKSVNPSDSASIFKQSISVCKEVVLEHHQNMFTMVYAALEYSIPGKNQYAYKLEGLNQEWIQAGHERQATFTNLDPGSYILRVKGSNNDGVWSEEEVVLGITVLPPWWLTWWAYTIYVLSTAAFLAAVAYFWLHRIRLRNQLYYEEKETNRLRELDQFKQRFIANITHEFKTPVSLVLGPVSQLLEQLVEESDREKLEAIYKGGQRLHDLVNQLLDLAKLEEGVLKSDLRHGDIVLYAKELVRYFEPMAIVRQVTLSFESEVTVSDVQFDFSALDKILANLITNGVKFCRPGGKVHVCIGRASEQEILIRVKDNGIGISEEAISRVFERFYQAQQSEARMADGTGIGLALVKELVQFLGGQILVSSKEGEGTVFSVRLPVLNQKTMQPIRYQMGSAELTKQDREETGPENQDNILLVVEDSKDLQQYISSVASSNFEVVTADNGAQGLAKAMSLVPDFIILDIMMPEMNGLEVLARLKSDVTTSHIPVLMLTAQSTTETRIASFEAGADAYLSKPFNPAELLVRMKQIMQSRKVLQQKYQYPGSQDEEPSGDLSLLDRSFLERVKAHVMEGLNKSSYNTEDLAASMNMSRPHLYRKIKAITDQSISQYMRAVRLARSRELLGRGEFSVSEVAYSTGFSSNTYFSQCFKEQYGISPSDFMKKIPAPHS